MNAGGTAYVPSTVLAAGGYTMPASNAFIELGSTSIANTPFFDFHSSGNNIDNDVRLMATGGSATVGTGVLNVFGTFNSAPPVGTTTRGFTQTIDMTTGSLSAPANDYALNDMVSNESLNAVIGVEGYKFSLVSGGSNAKGGRSTVYAWMNQNAPTNATNPYRFYGAGTFFAQTSGDGGTAGGGNQKGAIFGLNPVARAITGATFLSEVTGGEVNFALQTGSSANYLAGWTIVTELDHAVHGSVVDAGLVFSAQAGALGLNDIILVSNPNGVFPSASTGTILRTTAGTFATGIDMSASTCTDLIKGPAAFDVSCAGVITATSFNVFVSSGSASAVLKSTGGAFGGALFSMYADPANAFAGFNIGTGPSTSLWYLGIRGDVNLHMYPNDVSAGNVIVDVTTASTSKTTGAFVVSGGVGVAGKIFTDTLNVVTMANSATTSAVCYNTGTGLLTYDGTIGTCTVSDERLKNIGPRIDHALEKLLTINGVYYTWKDPAMGAGRQIGVGAQTVARVFPELVQTDSEGRESADYQRLTAPIIEALRELKADNDNLKTEIHKLRRSL